MQGKTTVAKLYGRILKDLGFLSSGETVVTDPSDFLADHSGGSEKKTAQIMQSAQGKARPALRRRRRRVEGCGCGCMRCGCACMRCGCMRCGCACMRCGCASGLGPLLGQSPPPRRGQREARRGGLALAPNTCQVLLIDEAYGLAKDDPYCKAVIDTLVSKVPRGAGADICVIMCGYEHQMDDMMRKANPGLKSRFNTDEKFVFEDYSDEVLLT